MERISSAIASRSKRGFTLVEILIIAPVLLAALTLMGSILIRMYGDVVVESHKVLLRAEAQKLSAQISSDLAGVTAFTSTIDGRVVDEHAPADGWTYNTQPATLIAKLPDRPVAASPGSKTSVLYLPDCTDPASIQAIYYVTGSGNYRTLLRRTAAPAASSLCGASASTRTCPPETASATCPSDSILSDRLADFSVEYLDDHYQILDVRNAASNAVPEAARYARITITTGEIAYGKAIKESATTQVKIHVQ